MHLFPTGAGLNLLGRMMVSTTAVLFGLVVANTAFADCDDYYAKSGAAPGADDCMAKCTTGQTSLGTFSCPNHCKEFCGSAKNPCDLQPYKEEWDRPDNEPPIFSDRDILYLKSIGKRLLDDGVSGVLSQKGVPVLPGVSLVPTNQKHIRDILNAKSDRDRAEASLQLYLSITFTAAGRDFQNEVIRNWMEFMDIMNQKDGIKRYNQYRSDVSKARAKCGGAISELPTYQEDKE